MKQLFGCWFAFICMLTISGCGGGGGESAPTPTAPQITTSPAPITVTEGQSATLSATASGTAPLSYQWQRNGIDVAGATASTYSLPATSISDDGAAFSVVVSNSVGRVTSGAASLTVTGNSIVQTIGSSGGAVTMTSNGVKTTITFPANAVVTNTAVTLQSLPPVGKELARIDIRPIGLQFGVPVTIKFEIPASHVPRTSSLVGLNLAGKKIILPSTVDATARSVSTQVQYFGMQAGVALNRFVDDDSSRKQTLDANSGTGGTLTLDELAILQPAEDVVNQALVDLQAQERFAEAAQLQLSIANLIQLGTSPEWQIEADNFLQGAAVTVCAALSREVTTAQSTAVTSYGDYQNVAKGVVYWASASQALGGNVCTGTTWINTLQSKLGEALSFISGKVSTAPPLPASPRLQSMTMC